MNKLTLSLNNSIMSEDQHLIKTIHDDLIDEILFFQDIFSLKIDRVTYILTNSLFYYYIAPLLCGPLMSINKLKINPSVVLYILIVFFYFVKEESFLNVLFLLLFEENINVKLKRFIENQPEIPQGFFFDWSEQKEKNEKKFYNFISQNFSENFLKSIIYMSNSPYIEIKNIAKYFQRYNEDIANSNNNFSTSSKSDFMEILKEQILTKFSQKQIKEIQRHHKNLSRATGINVGLILDDEAKNSFLEIYDEFFRYQNVITCISFNDKDFVFNKAQNL